MPFAELSCRMKPQLGAARAVAAAAVACLIPTAILAAGSRVAVAFAVLEAAVLAVATAYAVFLGVYRFPR